MRRSDTFPLLALVDATAVWQAGISRGCSASVRLLDRVHVAVHRGDCVIVHHDDPASAQVLLAALGGHDALLPGRRLHGARYCAPGVRIRRCSISLAAAAAVEEGWRSLSAAPDRPAAEGSHPVVHLLRASRRVVCSGHERAQWRHWARRAAAAEGAVVVLRRPNPEPAVTSVAPPATARGHGARWPRPERIHEGAAPAYVETYATAAPTHVFATPPARHARELRLHHGRLFSLQCWE